MLLPKLNFEFIFQPKFIFNNHRPDDENVNKVEGGIGLQ